MPTAYANSANKTVSLIWVTISYLLCCGAAYYYLAFGAEKGLHPNWFGGGMIVQSFIAEDVEAS